MIFTQILTNTTSEHDVSVILCYHVLGRCRWWGSRVGKGSVAHLLHNVFFPTFASTQCSLVHWQHIRPHCGLSFIESGSLLLISHVSMRCDVIPN